MGKVQPFNLKMLHGFKERAQGVLLVTVFPARTGIAMPGQGVMHTFFDTNCATSIFESMAERMEYLAPVTDPHDTAQIAGKEIAEIPTPFVAVVLLR